MVTLTINRKPQGIFSKSPATPLQDKTNTAHNEKPLRVRNQTPWRHMTKRQRKNRKRINRLVDSGLSYSAGKNQNHLKWGYLTT